VTHENTTRDGPAPEAAPPPSPPPPHGPRLRVILLVAVLMAAALAAGVVWSENLKSLVRPRPTETPQTEEAKTPYYTCGMHPWVILPKPGQCPICHMDLVPVQAHKETNVITIDPVLTQNIGVRVTPVTRGPVRQVVRTVGSVDYDERLVRGVSLKVSGWVEKLYANATGQEVEADAPLLEIYAPDLYSAQEEYLLAFRQQEAAGRDAAPPMTRAGADLLESARKRLEYLDISAEQIRTLEKAGRPSKTLVLRSPFRGTVVAKNVFEGQKVEAGVELLRLADLSKVWVLAAIYEYQLPFIEVGQKAAMTLPYVPGQVLEGQVAYVYPYLNPELRQAKVRLEFDNPTGRLKPGMFANVELVRTLASDRILVPREAVIDTGMRQVALVSLGQGRFDPRPVRVGVESEGGMLEILDGLRAGELVVTSSEFLLDSEARWQENLAKMVAGNLASAQTSAAAPAPAGDLAELPEPAAKALATILERYGVIGSHLADDNTEAIAAAARDIAAQADALTQVPISGRPHFWHEHAEVATIGGKAVELAAAAGDLGRARETFGDLSIALSKLLRTTGVPPAYGKPVEELHCPMFRAQQGGTTWLQNAGDAKNPYYGKEMLDCFDQRAALPVTGARNATP
jgi:membrane fusion protein, copper/silver efflux system